jgi:hypothetical protein
MKTLKTRKEILAWLEELEKAGRELESIDMELVKRLCAADPQFKRQVTGLWEDLQAAVQIQLVKAEAAQSKHREGGNPNEK